MAKNEAGIKFKITAFLGYLLSFLLIFSSYYVYKYLPISDSFTNSTEYSGAETVKVFLTSPITAFLSAIMFLIFAFTNRKYYYKLISLNNKIGKVHLKPAMIEWIMLVVSLVITALLIVSGIMALTTYNKFNEIGFVAPYNGLKETPFEKYESFIFSTVIINFVFMVLSLLRMLKINWLDSLICLIIKIKNKIKTSIKNK